jgi:predicted DsbA family dithiol-disulfide isomerase
MSMLSPSRRGTRPEVAPGTVVVYTDVVCGWSTVALHGLARARAEAGLDDTEQAEADNDDAEHTRRHDGRHLHAAKLQSLRASEQLDMALRLAFFRDSRCIALRHEIVDVAAGCDAVDADALGEALDDGRIRGRMRADARAHRDAVQGSSHLFLADGHVVHNPGIELHRQGDPGGGFPVVGSYDPEVFGELVARAAAATWRS